jgi:hypothetical protein
MLRGTRKRSNSPARPLPFEGQCRQEQAASAHVAGPALPARLFHQYRDLPGIRESAFGQMQTFDVVAPVPYQCPLLVRPDIQMLAWKSGQKNVR